ncbi:hypothetical protein QTH97_23610 [Variovorax sp. J22R24]|uniref:hypothetical protein n=1 Tax=Variovorax gracilis TaxID=3053502 RepID=UPI0025753111|nr:hypothetical protein [Variovorax sp. J22R24]MDM0107955.1 hypothetical protein [Variovorax sp. J22R24]
MSALVHTCFGGIALFLAGCGATNPPLMFGDMTTFGLRLGNDTSTGGASVSLGYKAQSIAVVPVSVLDENGVAKLLKGHGQGADGSMEKVDAMSVFASFESDAPASSGPKGSTVHLGQVFSTGVAAQALTEGYICRESGDKGCGRTATGQALDAAASANAAARTANNAAARATQALAGQPVQMVAPATRKAENTTPATDRPYQSPLLFLRTDVIGFDIGGSLAQQGLQFALGYSNRNLALIPVHAQGSGGRVVRITGGNEGEGNDPSLDVLSVLGQFRTNTETAQLGFGLDRYFATGVAARNLGESLGLAISKVPTPDRAPASTPAPAVAAAPISVAKTAK